MAAVVVPEKYLLGKDLQFTKAEANEHDELVGYYLSLGRFYGAVCWLDAGPSRG
jgi:hypothetical protein